MFKAYDKKFIEEIKIESSVGFTLGLELVVKAKLKGKSIGEIPTIWIDRAFGESKFNLRTFIPKYLKWIRRLLVRKSMSEKVLVTGSEGFIGGYIVKELLQRRV